MINDAIIFVLTTLFQLVALAAITRFWMQSLRTGAQNPVAQFCMALTDWLIKPMRRVIPALGRHDTASVLAAFILLIVLSFLIFAIRGLPVFAGASVALAIILHAASELLRLNVYFFIGAILISAIFSWVNPHHPFRHFFDAMSRPLLKPIRAIVPPIGNVDLSPLVAILLLQLVLMLPVRWLSEHAVKNVFNQLV
jgi:YggT family protein